MFSPAARSVRRRVLNCIINSTPTLDSNELAELDSLDPDVLSGADQAAFYDLREYEDRFTVFMSTKFNYSTLDFSSRHNKAGTLEPLSIQSILKSLPSAHSATQQLSYRWTSLESLLVFIQSTQCIHPALIAQKEELGAAVQLELEDLVNGASGQRVSQLDQRQTCQGLRVVNSGRAPARSYTSPLATSVIILAAIIHNLMGVARESCNFILMSLKAILSMASSMQGTRSELFMNQHLRDIPISLPVALQHLNLPPSLQLYITCPRCCYLYKEQSDSHISDTCTARNIDNVVCGENLYSNFYRGGKSRKRPARRFSHQLFEDWLSEVLLRPGVEDMLESAAPRPTSLLTDVWDGTFLNSFPIGEPSFFDAPPDELRLCMLLFHDFFNPLRNKTAGKLRSVGCVYMVCLNLPSDLRYDTSYAYLAAIIPGPSEPSMENLQHFLRPIADEMLEFYDPGVWVARTHKYPRGRKVRVAVPLNCMDTPAARAFGGFAGHSHTCFCYLCSATLSFINSNTLLGFHLRTMQDHRARAAQWANAPSLAIRKQLFNANGVRSSEWLRFTWWDAFGGTVVGPMHWTRNVLDKQLRRNMGWSWTLPTGTPEPPNLARPISKLEYEWGLRALCALDGPSFEQYKLPEPLARYMCRQRGVFEAGLSGKRLMLELNKWRAQAGVIDHMGNLVPQETADTGVPVSVAKAHYFLSRAKQPSALEPHATIRDLQYLCQQFGLTSSGRKHDLAERLFDYYATIRVQDVPETIEYSTSKKELVAVLGVEVLTEVLNDMGRTTLPRWLKHPPRNFGTVSHGKLQAEEYKSLALVSFVFTLGRIWGAHAAGPLRERLDNFLHLMLAVRILSFQSLVESDIVAFEHNYHEYLKGLPVLYPYASRTPVQHMGLHIPSFLRALGPSTRLSESTCEMFIGLLQDISTNFKFGDLELTMHREFIMAARSKGLIDQDTFTSSLGQFGDVARQFIGRRMPGRVGDGWNTAHSATPVVLDDSSHTLLNNWALLQHTRQFSRRLFSCTSIQQGRVFYAPYTSSSGDSCVLFCTSPTAAPCPGRIDVILEESSDSVPPGTKPRIVLFISPFVPLSVADARGDPYWNHPLIGQHGAAIARVYYDGVSDNIFAVEPRSLVAHVAVCNYHMTRVSARCVAVLSLDLVSYGRVHGWHPINNGQSSLLET